MHNQVSNVFYKSSADQPNPGESNSPRFVECLGKYLSGYTEYIAESLGTMVLIVIGDGSVAQSFYQCSLYKALDYGEVLDLVSKNVPIFNPRSVCPPPVANPNVHISWGLAVMLGVYVCMGFSAAHLNPAVTLASCVFGRFSYRKLPAYMISQFIGAFLGAAVVFAVYGGAYKALKQESLFDKSGFVSVLSTGPFLTKVQNTQKSYFNNTIHYVLSELTGTVILVLSILVFSDKLATFGRIGSYAVPVFVGLTVTAIGMSFGLLTGYAINPFRDFAPRLLAFIVEPRSSPLSLSSYYFFIPLLVPFIGALLGFLIYTVALPSRSYKT